jgi:Na+/H+-dicarboxylate symporter
MKYLPGILAALLVWIVGKYGLGIAPNFGEVLLCFGALIAVHIVDAVCGVD